MQHAEDRHLLARAIAIACRAGARSSPNPGVGCVVADHAGVIAEGVTAATGGPHAESVALETAGARARGATAYVTLEPCGHHGRTPPCAQAIADAGIRRVVYVHADPNPVAAGGARRLAEAGVEVDGPLGSDGAFHTAVADELSGFLSVLRRGRPQVTLKLAQTARGSLTAQRRWVTGVQARRAVHRWRATSDAVLVGSGTIVDDDPRLDVRDAAATRQPRAVVFDGRLRTETSARVCRRGTIVVTHDGAPRRRRSQLIDVGVDVVDVAKGPAGGIQLAPALAALAARGVTTVFAEPGRTLAEALLSAGLVDRVVLHIADGASRRGFHPAVDLRGWRTVHLGVAGDDRIAEYVPESEAA